jgi:hypothetical protein
VLTTDVPQVAFHDDPGVPPRDTPCMTGHLKHIAICGVFAAVAIVMVATGTSVAILIPVAACVVMMGVMMAAMGKFAARHHGGD